MHKCIVCGNTYDDTKVTRPGVIYHGFPKDECMRRRWLKVYGIDSCFDWHRICSDHFLEKNYKPIKKRFLYSNTIPQPYDRNGFPSNSATQSNGVETGNNVILPMEQNIIKEKLIGNASVNGFKSPRLTRNNEDMSNKNMLDRALRPGVQCSVKNCFNRLSKNLSLFGYPKDFELRKMWIENLGVNKDPAKIVLSGIRICSAHFERNCFSNLKLKNRIKYGSVPSLHLNNAPPALPVSINEAPVVLSSCEDDQFISPMDYEAAEQTSEGKQNNVKEPPVLPVSINEAHVVLSSCEENNVKDNTHHTSMTIDLTIDDSSNSSLSITLEPTEDVVSSTCEDDQFISPMDYEAAEQTSEGKQNNVKEPPVLPVSINEAPVVLSTCEENNVKDNTHHTSMIIDLTIDDSSNSSLEPTEDEHGIIFQLSKKVVLPSLYWKSEHLSTENATRFHEQDPDNVTVKKITFSNNLVPTIEVYGKEYEYKTPITSMKELDNLLEKIDSIEKCYGRGGFVFKQCLGYFENSSVNMCSGCEGLVKDQDLQRMKAKVEAKKKLAQSLNNRIAEQKVLLIKKRKEMAERKRQLALDSNHSALPSGSSNIVKP